MPTITEIRQKLIQGGMTVENAQAAATILADVTPINSPTGGYWDTLKAKGYLLSQRYSLGNSTLRLLSNGTRQAIVITTNGIDTLYADTDISTL